MPLMQDPPGPPPIALAMHVVAAYITTRGLPAPYVTVNGRQAAVQITEGDDAERVDQVVRWARALGTEPYVETGTNFVRAAGCISDYPTVVYAPLRQAWSREHAESLLLAATEVHEEVPQ